MRRALLLLAGLALTAAAVPPAAQPISRMSLPWWRARHEAKLAEKQRGPVDLVFLGDSITQNWEHAGPPAWSDYQPVWQRFYGDRHALNLGFKGDATSHLLWRLEHGEIDGIAPKAAVILIGANNLGHLHWSAPADIVGIEAVVDETQRRLPHTRILLLGVLPSERSPWVTRNTAEINQALATHYGRGAVPGVAYMDLGGIFVRHGVLDRTRFEDVSMDPPDPPLHPSVAAQTRMAEAMEPALSAMLGDRDHRR